MIIFSQTSGDNDSLAEYKAEIDRLRKYIESLTQECNAYKKIIQNQLNIYEIAQQLLNEIQKIKLMKDGQDQTNQNIDNNYQPIADTAIQSMRELQKQIRENNNMSDLNINIETLYFKAIQENFKLKTKLQQTYNNLKVLQQELELEQNINSQLSESTNKVKEYINQITSIINASYILQDSTTSEIEYYKNLNKSLSNELEHNYDEIEKLNNKIKDLESRNNYLERSVKHYEESQINNTSISSMITYILNNYAVICESGSLMIDYINTSSISEDLKIQLAHLIKNIKEDKYKQQMNSKIISYIIKTDNIKQNILSIKNIGQLKAELNQYLQYTQQLNLYGTSIDYNNGLINRYIGQISHTKYNSNNLHKDSQKLADSLHMIDISDIKLDITEININKKSDSTNSLNTQMNLLLNLILLVYISEIIKDRKTLENNLDKYNEYVLLLSKISNDQYPIFNSAQNQQIIEKLQATTNAKIREYINKIGKNSKEHPIISKLGIKFQDICGDIPNIKNHNILPKILNIATIMKDELLLTKPILLELIKNLKTNENNVMISLFENRDKI